MSGYRASVIIRTFNRPDMLRRSLASVAKQSWKDVEAVVVNDGGEDVQPIIDEVAQGLDVVYLNFSAAEKPGRCLAATRGIEASTGQWICYLDDDDFYLEDHVETLMVNAKETGAKVLYTDAHHGVETKQPDGTYKLTKVIPGPSEDFSKVGFYFGVYIHLSTFCHHRSVFDEFGGFDPDVPVLEDLDLYFRNADDHDFVHIEKVTAQFNIRNDGTNAVTSMRREFIETRRMLCQKYLHIAIVDLLKFCDEGMSRVLGFAEQMESVMARLDSIETRLGEVEQGGAGLVARLEALEGRLKK